MLSTNFSHREHDGDRPEIVVFKAGTEAVYEDVVYTKPVTPVETRWAYIGWDNKEVIMPADFTPPMGGGYEKAYGTSPTGVFNYTEIQDSYSSIIKPIDLGTTPNTIYYKKEVSYTDVPNDSDSKVVPSGFNLETLKGLSTIEPESSRNLNNRSVEFRDNDYTGHLGTVVTETIDADGNTVSTEVDHIYNTQSMIRISDVSIQNVREDYAQMSKVSQMFDGDWRAFFLGSRAVIMSFTAIVADDEQGDYEDSVFKNPFRNLKDMYNTVISASKSIDKGLNVVVYFDRRMVRGYITQMSFDTNSENDVIKQVNFQMLVREEAYV